MTGKTPQFYERLSSHFEPYAHVLGALCQQQKIPEALLERLLQHPSIHVRAEVALGMFAASKPPTIPSSLRALWRAAVLGAISSILTDETHGHLLHLPKLLDFDPSLAISALDDLLESERKSHHLVTNDLCAELVSRTTKEQRRVLLRKCNDLIYSYLPQLLVGGDAELARDLLENPELKRFHLQILDGDPTHPEWGVLAKLALRVGYTHSEIAHATIGNGFSWSGHLSEYYQGWVDRFELLQKNADPDLLHIGAEGLKWAVPARDAERGREKREEIDGWN